MKTDDLIAMLASGETRPALLPRRHVALTVGLGLLATIALMSVFLGVRPNLSSTLMVPAFWTKSLFVVALASAGWIAVKRLSAPGVRTGTVPWMIAVPLVVIWSIAAMSMMDVAPDERGRLFWGETWRSCPLLIAGLSLPVFAAILHVMHHMAPTRLHIAGAAAGFTAGAVAATVYSLHCPEVAAPFVGFWYLIGILMPTALGALIGPRVLRW